MKHLTPCILFVALVILGLTQPAGANSSYGGKGYIQLTGTKNCDRQNHIISWTIRIPGSTYSSFPTTGLTLNRRFTCTGACDDWSYSGLELSDNLTLRSPNYDWSMPIGPNGVRTVTLEITDVRFIETDPALLQGIFGFDTPDDATDDYRLPYLISGPNRAIVSFAAEDTCPP
ncbi:MAG: hypothetical protein OXC17_10700 [Aestuariivita sp.]|nr:hypothetical protein [Aestuariivita sp.]